MFDAIFKMGKAVKRAKNHKNHKHFSSQVVLLVTLDIRNAFNSSKWCESRAVVPSAHLCLLPTNTGRLLERQYPSVLDSKTRKMIVTSGRPEPWNKEYCSLLWMQVPEETCLVRYADYVIVHVAARTVGLVSNVSIGLNLKRVMWNICIGIAAHGL